MDGPDRPGSQTLALVGLSGPSLRFAEVVTEGDRPARRLRRLGAVDFDFDAEQAVFGDGHGLDEVRRALGDVLAGTEARVLGLVAHPPVTTTFFTPLPADLPEADRDAHLAQETALLADTPPTQALRIRAVPVRTEWVAAGERRWFHVVHVGVEVHDRLSGLADALGVPGYDVVDATRAAAAAASAVAGPDGTHLVVGGYAGHTEVALCRDGAFVFGYHGPGTTPADTAYFSLAALQHARLDVSDVDRLLVYGDECGPDRLGLTGEFLDRPLDPLDAFERFGRTVDMPASERAAFAPVLGGAL